MRGHICTFGVHPNITRLFYYARGGQSESLYVEVIDRRNRDVRHLVRLVDQEGKPVKLPKGCVFEHVSSAEELHLLDNYLRRHEQ